MKRQIRITAGSVVALSELNATKTADAIWEALPLSGRANLWGEEIYFAIPVKMGLEEGKEIVEPGDLGYWPEGNAFCLFFGPTPISEKGEIRPASAVNLFGRLITDPKMFKGVKAGERIVVERV